MDYKITKNTIALKYIEKTILSDYPLKTRIIEDYFSISLEI
jgi:hypothetical protein